MKIGQFKRWMPWVSLIIIAFTLIMALLQFRLVSHMIERVTVTHSPADEQHPLDTALLNNIGTLAKSDFLQALLANTERTVNIAPFAISTCQTTQSQYNAFSQWVIFNSSKKELFPADAPQDQPLRSRFFDHSVLGRSKSPVTGVDFNQAHAYCKAAGGRLPTADEWEAAASGKERRIYPWGNTYSAAPWRFRNPILNVVQHCDAYPQNNTPEGIADLGNSVSEWTVNNGKPMLKGGNAFNRPYSLHALNIVSKPVAGNFSSQFVGFRCAFDNVTARSPLPWDDKHQVIAVTGGTYTLGIDNNARLPAILSGAEPEAYAALGEVIKRRRNTSGAMQVSRYEITVAEYAWFLRDPLARLNYYANEKQPTTHSYLPDFWEQQVQTPDAPVVGISWWDAFAFATWAGARLPSLREWEQWYGGSAGYVYPWGNQYQPGRAIVREPELLAAGPQPVTTSFDENDFGLVGLSGNVSEWTSSAFLGSNELAMIVKGGNYLIDGATAARIDYAVKAPLYHRSPAIGFRIVFQ